MAQKKASKTKASPGKKQANAATAKRASGAAKSTTKKTPRAAAPQKSSPRAAATPAPLKEAIEHVGVDVGDSAPSFVLQDHTGSVVSSESLRGSPYVIYFYPKDDTPGCTLEACGFRDAGPRFDAKGVRVIGISPDSPATHARFRQKYGLSFSLLSDPEKTLSKAYGVWVKKQNYGREYMGVERSTFAIDRHGIVRKVWRRVRVPGHVDEVVHSV